MTIAQFIDVLDEYVRWYNESRKLITNSAAAADLRKLLKERESQREKLLMAAIETSDKISTCSFLANRFFSRKIRGI